MNPDIGSYITALHIIFIVTWFAGLFYIVRLFVYHAEAEKKESPEKEILQGQYKIMEKRLWYGITWPSLIGTYFFGGWLLYDRYGVAIPSWLLLKLCFVLGLTLYHIRCHVMFRQFQQHIVKHSSFMLRLWNEVATIFLVAIVFIVELRDTFSYVNGLLGLILFSVALWVGIKIYRNKRQEKEGE